MKVDGSLIVDDPADAGPAALRLERAGYAGGFSFVAPFAPDPGQWADVVAELASC